MKKTLLTLVAFSTFSNLSYAITADAEAYNEGVDSNTRYLQAVTKVDQQFEAAGVAATYSGDQMRNEWFRDVTYSVVVGNETFAAVVAINVSGAQVNEDIDGTPNKWRDTKCGGFYMKSFSGPCVPAPKINYLSEIFTSNTQLKVLPVQF